MPYTLSNDGDWIEKALYRTLIQPRFPSYETFWQKFVVPLTGRPADMHFRTDGELVPLGFGPQDICIAQLHYTVLVQLKRCLDLLGLNGFNVDHLVFGISCLVGAQDVAFELLERFAARSSGRYDPWLDKRPRGRARINGGKEAQEEWKRKERYPLQDIRDYRNNLVHGRTPPGIVVNGAITVPKLGKQRQYFDSRFVTAATISALPIADFDTPPNLFDGFLATTVDYFESAWQAHLLPNL